MTDTTTPRGARARPPRPGPLGRLAAVSYRRRGRVLVAWALALAAASGLTAAFGGDFTVDYATSGSDSKQAQDLLTERFPEQAGEPVDVVVHADDVTDPAVRDEVTTLLDDLETLPHVTAAADPYDTPGAIAADGQTLLARLNLDVANPEDMPVADTETILSAADAAERPGLEIALGGETIRLAEAGEFGSEIVGLVAAAIILLVTFGSVVAAGLPISVALAGLAVSASLTGLVAAAFDVPDWAPILASLLGIALGIDYVLLMVTRFREWRAAGLDPERSTVATLDTAGRSVLVAGATVMVSMLGLFAMGLSYMQGAAVVTMVAVLMVIAVATTLFPALLGFLGRHIDRLRLPLGRRGTVRLAAGGHVEPGVGWRRWSRSIGRYSKVAVVGSVALLLLLATPFLGTRFGFPDAGNDPEGNSSRQTYDMVSDGFGPGANGPLLVVADLAPAEDDAAGQEALDQLATSLGATAGVASVAPPQLNPAGDAALISVVPESGPQDGDTEDLARELRADVIPPVTDATGAEVHVGGVTAAVIDSNADMADRLPLLIGGVVAVSMLLLLLAFRSVAIPLTAAAMNLLSVAASYGVVALVLEGGWAGGLIGIDAAAPMPAFVPVTMFAILFGLSMDYEVFLISRMRESWVRTGDNSRAIVDGLAGTGRVITAAAAIMVAVFAALVPSPDVVLKAMGVGMAAAILIDATIVRMLLVPATMHVLGRANWWAPRALDRRLPQLHVEGRPEVYLDPAEPEPELAGVDRR
ncbi:RND superfamily putative drug exporter [Haloactinopolyspora alba]|uniref:RND superfamily putative drug exporter n=1 Tax=Haloactinopolyspora alba TaxID=648780 RepID=A0A2P8E8U1_9ACTN|nr:MMPL family transporter [Haloactinopolyspora alba]PSL05881.1 RND superfamily putative drug exporter [Haloactinopolyspora alba]